MDCTTEIKSTDNVLYYEQPEKDAQQRERRMKLTGLFMSIALSVLAGTFVAIKTNAIDIKQIILMPSAVAAILLLFLWLTSRYELYDWHCFSQHDSEAEYQATALQAEQSFKKIFKYLPVMLYYPALVFGVNFLMQYCKITIPYIHASMICFVISGVLKWLITMLKEQYIPVFDLLKTLAVLAALTMACASCI